MPKFQPRRVRNAEDRNKGRGKYIALKRTGDQFLGYALFAADPEMDDNPGYYEYFEHYTPATGYVGCAGDDCPLCADGDSASTRAKGFFLVVENEDDDPDTGEARIFNMNYYTLQDFAEDGAGGLGQLYRVKRQEGNGVYSIRTKTGKLNKTQLKTAMKDIEDDQLEKQVISRMNKVYEEMDVAAAMDADDDDDDDKDEPKASASKSRKGTPKEAEPKPDDDDDNVEDVPEPTFDPGDDATFEGNVVVVKTVKRTNTATVQDEAGTEFVLYGTDDIDVREAAKGDEFTASAGKDEDGDFVLDMWEPVEANGTEPTAEDAPDKLEDENVTITKVDTKAQTFSVEMEDGTEFELFFMGNGEDANGKDWSEFDIDDYSVGDKISISATRDSDGDMLADTFPETSTKGRKTTKTSGRK